MAPSNGVTSMGKIVMTPIVREGDHAVTRIERRSENEMLQQNGGIDERGQGTAVFLPGGGPNGLGLVIRKACPPNVSKILANVHLSLSFRVFLVNGSSGMHTEELRLLRYRFSDDTEERDRSHIAQDFFRALVSPSDFPRDYVGFFMKIMKLLQARFESIDTIQVDITTLQKSDKPLSRPTSLNDTPAGTKPQISEQRVLEVIESAYPNPISLDEIASMFDSAEEDVHLHIRELSSKRLIKLMDNGSYMRQVQNESAIKMVKQMPRVVQAQQPTIAIITGQYCEKLAVDAMIDNKETFLRYKTEGESNVYTLGNIGNFRVVSTKLPAVGNSRGHTIAAGNATTRLLGSFQQVEYVFIVGVAGGVPHYTDWSQHVRLGDIVVSSPPNKLDKEASMEIQGKPYVYLECTDPSRIKQNGTATNGNGATNGSHDIQQLVRAFNYRPWNPLDVSLSEMAADLWRAEADSSSTCSWSYYLLEGMQRLQEDSDSATLIESFYRPPPETDKLYMSVGNNDLIEMSHPETPENTFDPRSEGQPMIHFGPIGCGKVATEEARQDLALAFDLRAYDADLHAVIDSINGNRIEKFLIIRGISDYADGTQGRNKKEWQSYSSLAAASFMKSVILSLEPIEN